MENKTARDIVSLLSAIMGGVIVEILDAEGQRVLTVIAFGFILIFVRLLWPDKEQKRLEEKLDSLIQKEGGGSYSSKPVVEIVRQQTVNEILAEKLTEEERLEKRIKKAEEMFPGIFTRDNPNPFDEKS
ncbi:MAG: hypothetical protein OXH71_01535 [Candidatus Dadabacteria bacterium]|nr:hypothetical protein [Candidatus Dadabacteria bacterium]